MPLPTNYTNDTPSQDQHPAAHNQTNVAVNANETAIAANQVAMARLPKGNLAVVNAAGGTAVSATPYTFATPTLTVAGRRLKVTLLFVGSASATATLNVSATVPTAITTPLQQVAATIATTGGRTYIYQFAVSATANGPVSVAMGPSGPQTVTVENTTAMWVDDMGAV